MTHRFLILFRHDFFYLYLLCLYTKEATFFCRLFSRKNVPVQFAVLISFLNQKPQDVRAKLPWFPFAEIFLFTSFEKIKRLYSFSKSVEIDPVKKRSQIQTLREIMNQLFRLNPKSFETHRIQVFFFLQKPGPDPQFCFSNTLGYKRSTLCFVHFYKIGQDFWGILYYECLASHN